MTTEVNVSRPYDVRRAVTEGAVIVISILLAFAIDAAWDRYEASVARAELIDALILDFETTGENLEAAIEHGESVLSRVSGLLGVIVRGESIAKDSIRVLTGGFFSAIRFVPSLAAYEAAVGEHGLASLESKAFLEADAEFRRARDFFDQHSVYGGNLFFRGPTLEIRRELGSLGVLEKEPSECTGDHPSNCPYPDQFNMSAEELTAYIGRPDVYGALENIQNLQINQVKNLRDMRTATDRILEVLHELDQ